jgi:hypothetical protein
MINSCSISKKGVKWTIGFGINSNETLIIGQNALLAAQQARKVKSQRLNWNPQTLKH